MGDTGRATGVHLHMEVIPCRIYVDSDCYTWDNYVNFATKKLANGYNVRNIINFPKGLYNSWKSR